MVLSNRPNNPLPRGVLFDMDGTLTEPLLDFPLIKRELGIGDRPILEALAEMDITARETATQILLRHEDDAAARSTLNPGCHELLAWLDDAGILTAIVTRNSRRSTEMIQQKHRLPFEVLITRDDGLFKPDPAPLLRACERLNIAPADAWMIGDGPYDVQAGLAANIKTVWLSHGKARPFPHEPWKTVRDLPELHQLLRGGGVKGSV